MTQKITEKEIIELERQLSCPIGDLGIEVGESMNKSNIGMILNTIQLLELKNKNSVLEIGHGNCSHLNNVLGLAKEIQYHGVEISETMFQEAKKNDITKKGEFKLYNGQTIPYSSNYFHIIFSVNTIYFWSNPDQLISEIERTLKLNGLCVLTYANKDFMEKLPFVGQRFKLFDQNDIKELAKKSSLKIIESEEFTEKVKSKTGEQVERKYTITKLKKFTEK